APLRVVYAGRLSVTIYRTDEATTSQDSTMRPCRALQRSSRREGVDERSEETTGRRAAQPIIQRSSRREGVDERSEETTGRRAAQPIIQRRASRPTKAMRGADRPLPMRCVAPTALSPRDADHRPPSSHAMRSADRSPRPEAPLNV